ncbi:MAG: zinc ribbon domain-containing protein [Chloroflexota bacterium]
MDIGSFLLLFALLILVVWFVARPFLEHSPAVQSRKEQHEVSALLAERDRILNALRDLDFDHALHKISADDYPGQRSMLLDQGSEVLRKLDGFKTNLPLDLSPNTTPKDDAATITEVKSSNQTPIIIEDDAIEAKIAERRRMVQEKASGFCPQCGHPIRKSDTYCWKCGSKQT